MKSLVIGLILLSAIIIPLACGNQNNAPSGPISAAATSTATATPTVTPGGPTFTFTFTSTITATPTNTFAGGFTWTPSNTSTSTFTLTATGTVSPTPTFAIVAPVYQHNFGTTSSANSLVITGSELTVAEYDSTYGPMVEDFTVAAANNGTVNYPPIQANFLWQGFPTPTTTPGEAGYVFSTVNLTGPQGFVNPGGNTGYANVLDVNGSAATLYYGNANIPSNNILTPWNGWTDYNLGFAWEPYSTTGYNGRAFNSPKGLTADTSNNIYVADTGNNRVEMFNSSLNALGPQHAWIGNGGLPFANGFSSVTFISPYTVACDANAPATVYVGDNGYSPSVIQAFSSGGTTITEGFTTVKGCVVHGLAIGLSPNYLIYVSDAGNGIGNGQIEIYSNGTGAYAALPIGTLLSVVSDPHSYNEGNGAFDPTGIGFDANGYIWVGDAINRQIVSFH